MSKIDFDTEKYPRKMVNRSIPCDTERLYGDLRQAIAYLQEVHEKHPSAKLNETWLSYEDMTMEFSWVEEESDEEYITRVRSHIAYERELELIRRRRADAERAKDEKRFNELRVKLGY